MLHIFSNRTHFERTSIMDGFANMTQTLARKFYIEPACMMIQEHGTSTLYSENSDGPISKNDAFDADAIRNLWTAHLTRHTTLPFYSLLSIFSLIFLFILLVIFIFHVADKNPAHSCEWGVRHCSREQSSHSLWAQRPPHLRDYWKFIQESSSDNRSFKLACRGPRWLYIGRALSSPLLTQEREETAGHRQAYHSLEESLSSSQSSSVGHVRKGRPVSDQFDSLISNVRDPRRGSGNEQIRIL